MLLDNYKLGVIKSNKAEEYMIVIKANIVSKIILFRDIAYIRELTRLNNVLTLRGMEMLNYNRKGTLNLADNLSLFGIKYNIVPFAWSKESKKALDDFVAVHGKDKEIPDDVMRQLDGIPVFSSQHMAEKAIDHILGI